ncbi:DUF401 family protein [Candidatus Falkowbacteria bacterium]|nr:DUF401 family protein [Candidatus Falkowbacteria bacterium]
MIDATPIKGHDLTRKLNLGLNIVLSIAVASSLFLLAQPGKVLLKNFVKLENAEVLVLFIGMLFMVNLYRELGNIADYFLYWTKFIKNPRLSLIATSMVLGILPVKGRTIISAPIIGQIAQKNKLNKLSAALVDYLATHIVYFLLPIEGSVVVVLATFAATGLSLGKFVSYMLPGVLVLLAAVGYYSWKTTDNNSEYILEESKISFKQSSKATLPIAILMAALFVFKMYQIKYAMIAGTIIFISLSLYLLKPTKAQVQKSIRTMDKQLILTLVLIFLFSATISKMPQISILTNQWLASGAGLTLLGLISYAIGFIIGDSKGMTLAVFPIILPLVASSSHPFQIIAIIYAMLYAGYIASPAHACCHYAASYFETPYLKVWARFSLYGLAASADIIIVALIRG